MSFFRCIGMVRRGRVCVWRKNDENRKHYAWLLDCSFVSCIITWQLSGKL